MLDPRTGLLVLLLLVALYTTLVDTAKKGQIWAVLVAGNPGWHGYSQQADVCRMYQMLRSHNIPNRNIITIFTDDAANHPNNSMSPGTMRNRRDGPNVYRNMLRDYTGANATVDNFVKVLTRKRKDMKGIGSGKVLDSGPNDNVLIYFSGHGARNVIVFPDRYLYNDEMTFALSSLHRNNKYKKLFFILDSCFSGGFLRTVISEDWNMAGIAASDPYETAGAYRNKFQNQSTGGGVFTNKFLDEVEEIENNNIEEYRNMSLLTLFRRVQVRKSSGSHPTLWGNVTRLGDPLPEIFGDVKKKILVYKPSKKTSPLESMFQKMNYPTEGFSENRIDGQTKTAENEEESKYLEENEQQLLEGRKLIDELYEDIFSSVHEMGCAGNKLVSRSEQSLTQQRFPCFKSLVDEFNSTCVCITKNPYTLMSVDRLADLCLLDCPTEALLSTMSNICTEEHRSLYGIL